MKNEIRLAAVGDNCIDLYDQTGEAYPGGNPVNVAVYTVRLGGWASYTGVVGDDKYGALMRRAVAGKGVDVSHLRTEPGSTALSHVTVVDGDLCLCSRPSTASTTLATLLEIWSAGVPALSPWKSRASALAMDTDISRYLSRLESSALLEWKRLETLRWTKYAMTSVRMNSLSLPGSRIPL